MESSMAERGPEEIAWKFFIWTMAGTAVYVGVVLGFILFR
jgi:hypothetical protein